MKERSDADSDRLIARARQGDIEAFDLLLDRHRERLVALIYLRLGRGRRDQITPDDVLPLAKRQALLALEQFDGTGDGAFFRWIGGIAEDVLHRAESPPSGGRGGLLQEDSPTSPPEHSPAAPPVLHGPEPKADPKKVARSERLQRLEEAMGKLSPQHAEVIFLAAVRRLPVAEIASRLGTSADSVGPLLLSALRDLKRHLPPGLRPEWLGFMPEESGPPLTEGEDSGQVVMDPASPAPPRDRPPPSDATATTISILQDQAAGDLGRVWRKAPDGWSSHSKLLEELETLDGIDSLVAGDEELPRRFGDFERLRYLGGGGMGVVYEARQVSLDRRVALKVLRGDLFFDQRAVARFIREAKAAASINHPNVVKVLAMGTEGGMPYYVMELSPGKTLQQLLQDAAEKRLVERAGSRRRRPRIPAWLLPRRLREPPPEPFVLPGGAPAGPDGGAPPSDLGPFARLAQAFAGAAGSPAEAHGLAIGRD